MKPFPPDLAEWWSYDPETGVISWRKVRKTLRKSICVGRPVFTVVRRSGYTYISFRTSWYALHRVAWFLHTGEDPGSFYVDHINRDKLDNRFVNLRLATNSQNQANAKGKGERALPKGVYADPSGRFIAIIMVNRRQHRLGVFSNPHEAQAAYLEAARKHFGDFARAA